MSNIKSIGAFARLYCFVEICWNLHPFSELKNVFFANFRTFLKFSKCKALGDFLISFLERVPLKGCLGGISQNWNFWNWFEIRDIFRHWLLSHLNRTFFASSVFHEVLTKHYNVQETIHVLKSNDPWLVHAWIVSYM